tara:strand:+ start:850088 stop:851146 length:1059 start_codon:yes stop_codon:yes gene_type:complete
MKSTARDTIGNRSDAPIDYTTLYAKLDSYVYMHAHFRHALSRIDALIERAKRYADPEIVILLGESRCGKSRLLDIIEQKWPAHRTEEKTYVPILSIRITSKPTVKGLLTQLIAKLGAPSTIRYKTEQQQMQALITLLKRCGVRALMLDEFQHFLSDRGQVNYSVADLFKYLSDEAQISIIFAGLPEAKGVIDANEQLAGRASAALRLPRFNWATAAGRDEFKQMLVGCARAFEPIALPDLSSDEFAFRWYCASGGLIGLVLKIFRECLNTAAQKSYSALTLEDFDEAHRNAHYEQAEKGFRPFSKDFNPTPSRDAISHADDVGKSIEPVKRKRDRPNSKPKESSPFFQGSII